MASNNYIIKQPRKKKKKLSKSPALAKNPQKKATCNKIFKKTPRKPNSAQRTVIRAHIESLDIKVNVYLPGIGSNNLKEYSLILIKGIGPNDLPGVKYRAIRGSLDLEPVKNRITRRSKYGVKTSKKIKTRLFLLK